MSTEITIFANCAPVKMVTALSKLHGTIIVQDDESYLVSVYTVIVNIAGRQMMFQGKNQTIKKTIEEFSRYQTPPKEFDFDVQQFKFQIDSEDSYDVSRKLNQIFGKTERSKKDVEIHMSEDGIFSTCEYYKV